MGGSAGELHYTPGHDLETTARAEADVLGLGVLDAVDVGGTWAVVGGPEPDELEVDEAAVDGAPDPSPAVRRRALRRWLWASGAVAAALVLLLAAAIGPSLLGPHPTGAGPAPTLTPPAATAGTASTPVPTADSTPMAPAQPAAVVPAAQGMAPPPPGSSPSGPAPSPSDVPTPAPTPIPTLGPTPIPIPAVTALPPPIPFPLG